MRPTEKRRFTASLLTVGANEPPRANASVSPIVLHPTSHSLQRGAYVQRRFFGTIGGPDRAGGNVVAYVSGSALLQAERRHRVRHSRGRATGIADGNLHALREFASVNTIEAAMLAAVTIDPRKRFERIPPLTKQCSACGEIKIDRNDMVRTGTFGLLAERAALTLSGQRREAAATS